MKSLILAGVSTLALGAGSAWAETASNPVDPGDVIVVVGNPFASSELTNDVKPDDSLNTAADSASLANLVPGGALVNNGSVSGQFTYRGMFGPRLDVRIGGQKQTAGCPNLMDPPLSNAPLALLSHLEITRGIAPVKYGMGIGGSVDAVFKRMPFGPDDQFRVGYDVEAAGRSNNDSYRAGGMAGIANDKTALSLLADTEYGDDLHSPAGIIADTGYKRSVLGIGWEQKLGQNQIFRVEYRNTHVNDAGTPPLPMDLIFSHVDSIGTHWEMEQGDWTVTAQLGYDYVVHEMDNFSLRPQANPTKTRTAHAHAKAWTGKLAVAKTTGHGEFSFGVDGDTDDHSVYITSPIASAFFVTSFPNTEAHRIGAYAQWDGDLGEKWSADFGVRIDRTLADAGAASTSAALPPPVQMLKTAFNNADRSRDDTTADMVLRVQYQLNDATVLRLGVGQKSRAPGYVERYGWLPAASSNGLADGHIYVGNLDLKPEISREVEVGVDWSSAHAYFRPAAWLRNVDDYITGVPVTQSGVANAMSIIMVAGMNGDANPLAFANVPARLYGVDMDFGVRLSPNWRLDGVAGIVHGERRDIDDGLYRQSPAHATLSLTREAQNWSVTADGHFVANQDNISALNYETTTSGHVRFDVSGQWRVHEGVSLTAGVENVFDALYEEHLAGVNRVTGSAIAVGEKVPGAGRGVFVRLNMKR